MWIQRRQKRSLGILDFYGNQRVNGPHNLDDSVQSAEVKATLLISLATTEGDLLSKLEKKFLSWPKLRETVAIILHLKQIQLTKLGWNIFQQ